MYKEILSKLKSIRLFLFDLEGVLYFNENAVGKEYYKIFLSEVESACCKFKELGLYFGIVSARPKDKVIEDLSNLKNCTILSTSV